jgi:hypothetical protein
MLVWTDFALSLIVCVLSFAPFTGAVFLTPLLALLSLYLSMTRIHRLLIPACLLNPAALWLAPSSLRDEPFFGYLAMPVTALALIGVVAQLRRRAVR